jgi:hypothetical protein
MIRQKQTSAVRRENRRLPPEALFPQLPDAPGEVGANVAIVVPRRPAITERAMPLSEVVGSGP